MVESGTGGNERREHCPGRTQLAWLLAAGPGSSSRGAQQLLGEATWTRLPWQPVSLVTRGGRSGRSSSIKDEVMQGGVCREAMLGDAGQGILGKLEGAALFPSRNLTPQPWHSHLLCKACREPHRAHILAEARVRPPPSAFWT